MSKKICHQGVIESINGSRARIRTVRSAACDACEAAGTCHSQRGKDFHIDVDDPQLANRKPGDNVRIEISAASGRQAVAVGFGLPLVVFTATLLGMHYGGCSDEKSALAGLGVLAAYYIIIYALRRRMERHFKVRIAD